MIDLVPNWHPVWVHFTVGLLGGGVIFYLLSIAGRSSAWGARALAAAYWCTGAGIVFAVAALLTGWWAMNSVAHDDPAHANMLVHRNWAFGTAAVFVIAGLWMWVRRRQTGASFGVLALLLVAFAGLTVTGYEGGQNVFEHGLGVQRLPATGGHDHAAHGHGSGTDSGGEQSSSGHADDPGVQDQPADVASGPSGHDHAEDHADHEDGTDDESVAPARAGLQEEPEHDHAAHDHGEPAATAAANGTIDTGGLADQAQALSDAIADGDEAAIRRLLADDVLIFEGGGVERSLAEYASHHMGSDMAFLGAMTRDVLERRAVQGTSMGMVTTRTRLSGNWQDSVVNLVSSETLVFEQRDGQWQVVHIHWSSDG